MAKEFLTSQNVAYEDIDVSVDAAAREDMVEKSGQLGVPVFDIDGQIIGPLKQTTLPEHKRRIIGDTFLKLTQKAITDLGVLEMIDGEFTLTEIYQGVSVEQVKQNCGWPLKVAASLKTIKDPEPHVLEILRNKIDPDRLYL